VKCRSLVRGYVSGHFDLAAKSSVAAPVFIHCGSIAAADVRARRIILANRLNENVCSIHTNLLNQVLNRKVGCLTRFESSDDGFIAAI